MFNIRLFILGLVLAMFLSACVTAPSDEKAKVKCPACGTDFDALFQKRF